MDFLLTHSESVTVLPLLFLTIICQIPRSLTIEQPLVQGNLLNVQSKPFPFLHRRTTRANNNVGNSSRWIPVFPKLRKSMERPYFDQRSMNLFPQRPIPHNVPRAMSFHHPPHGFQMLRPSQPELQQSTNHLVPPPQPPIYSQLSSQPSNLVPSSSYLPLPPSPPPSNQNTGSGDVELNNPSESELRFLFHRPEDENLIKSTILNESDRYNERVTFVRGPTLKFQRRQTIYLPPKKKSVIYIMLKEPQVETDLEVIEPQLDPTPEVNIVYEKAGTVIKKHYYTTSDKNHEHISTSDHTNTGHYSTYGQEDLSSSESESKNVRVKLVTSVTSTAFPPAPALPIGNFNSSPAQDTLTSLNPCQPNFSKKLRKK